MSEYRNMLGMFGELNLNSSTTPYKLIKNEADAKEVHDIIMKKGDSESLALDVEGKNLSRTGPITLIQMGYKGEIVWLFDVIEMGKNLVQKYIKPILEAKNIKKIVFDCRNDSDSLNYQYDIVLVNVIDLQVYHQGILRAKGRFNSRYHKYIMGMKRMLREYGCGSKGSYDSSWNIADTLSEDILEYAAEDIELILDLYDKMKAYHLSNEMLRRIIKGSDEYLSRFRKLSYDIRSVYPRGSKYYVFMKSI